MNWQPIETAPKDGSWILLAGGECKDDEGFPEKRLAVGQWTNFQAGIDGGAYERWQFAWYDGGYYGEYKDPTHWMPLPDAPK